MPTPSDPLVIACNLDPAQRAALAAHPARPVVIDYAAERPVWEVPAEATCLFTNARGWKSAPADPPPGWPFALEWVQIETAGLDAYPRWLFDVPLVTNGRGITAQAIAEYVVAAVLAHAKGMFGDGLVTDPSGWRLRYLDPVAGSAVGFYGYGAIGAAAADRLRALGMQIHVLRRNPSDTPGQNAHRSLAGLIAAVDHLVLAVPLTDRTRRSLDAEALSHARPGLHVVNVCRGEVIDDNALLDALDAGRISAATLDVTAPEPLPEDHPFYTHPRIRLSPHISWTSPDTESLISQRLLANLDHFLAGRPLPDVVAPDSPR